jgi:hypothetical protein
VERKSAIVVPWRANSATLSPGGIGVRPPRRVRMSDWEVSGMVSSCPSVAAAAPTELTPGTISYGIPRSTHQRICSSMAP